MWRWASACCNTCKLPLETGGLRYHVLCIEICIHSNLTLNNVNRAHIIGPRTSITNRQHSRQILIQFKDHQSKTTFMKARKHLRGKQPTVFISEDLTQKRSRLLYLCREKNRKHQLQDCWSYDGRIVTKDSNGRIKTITCKEGLNEL